MKKKGLTLIFFYLLSCLGHTRIIKRYPDFKVEEIYSKTGVIWGMTHFDENHLLFSLRKGKMFVLDLNTKKVNEVKNVPTDLQVQNQAGLLDVKKHPTKDGWVYFTYSKKVKNEIICIGMGEKEPRYDNNSASNRSKNRRVEIYIN